MSTPATELDRTDEMADPRAFTLALPWRPLSVIYKGRVVLIQLMGRRLLTVRPTPDAYGVFLLELTMAFYLGRSLDARLFLVRTADAPNPALYRLEGEGVRRLRSAGARVAARGVWALVQSAVFAVFVAYYLATWPLRAWAHSRQWLRETAYGLVLTTRNRLDRRSRQAPLAPYLERIRVQLKDLRARLKPPRLPKKFELMLPLSLWPPVVWEAARRLMVRYERSVRMWDFDARRAYARAPIGMRLPPALERAAATDARALGLHPEMRLVTLHAREGGFGPARGVEERLKDIVRTVPIESYFPAIDALVARGYTVVRLGDPTMSPIDRPGVIDLATAPVRSGLVELWCALHSAFMITSDSGPFYLPWLLNRPFLAVNIVGTPTGAFPLRRRDMYILKRARDVRTDRWLTLPELMHEPYVRERFSTDLYEHVSNDAEDIRAAVEDMADAMASDTLPPLTPAQEEFRRAAQALVDAAAAANRSGGRVPLLGDGRLAPSFAARYASSSPPVLSATPSNG